MSINPLDIELVVENVFSNLSTPELRSCLWINQTWRKLAFEEFRKRQPIEAIGREGVRDTIECVLKAEKRARCSRLRLTACPLGCLHTLKLISLTGQFLYSLDLRLDISGPDELKNILIQLPNLAELTIFRISKQETPMTPFKLFPILLNSEDSTSEIIKFPKIRRLQFESSSQLQMKKEFSAIITPLSTALRTFPNLSELHVMDLVFEEAAKFKDLRPFKITKLCLHYTIFPDQFTFPGLSNEVIKMLIDMELKLDYLEIKYPAAYDITRFPDVDTTFLRNFIESQAPTLKILKFDQNDLNQGGISHEHIFCPFPLNLPNLEVIEIQKGFLRNFNCLNSTNLPSLIEARFRFPILTKWVTILPNVLKENTTLKVLRIDNIDGNSLTKLLKCFKSLETLHLANCNDYHINRNLLSYFPTSDELDDFLWNGDDDVDDGYNYEGNHWEAAQEIKTIQPIAPPVDKKNIRPSNQFQNLKHLILKKYFDQPITFFTIIRYTNEPIITPDTILDAAHVFQRSERSLFLSNRWMEEVVPGFSI